MRPELLAQISNIGLIIFFILYIYASTLYDGGSKVYPNKKSWDWINNYWCDLIWPETIIGEPNRASKWGITANSILCLSLIFFFFAFSFVYAPEKYWVYIISISGTITMICGMLIFSELHDKLIGIISLSSIPALIGVAYGLIYFYNEIALYWGLVSVILIGINIYIFYTRRGEKFLPLIQKVAYAIVLSWLYFINTTI